MNFYSLCLVFINVLFLSTCQSLQLASKISSKFKHVDILKHVFTSSIFTGLCFSPLTFTIPDASHLLPEEGKLPKKILVQSTLASAKNLPDSTGASANERGTANALVPVLKLQSVITETSSILSDDLQKAKQLLDNGIIPKNERDFKKIFDSFSEGVSYKQQYLDKNAFVVYYTKGFDGPGRESIETNNESEAKQIAQYGFRNDAWVAIDDARSELDYLLENPDDDRKDLLIAIKKANKAVSEYLKLAPTEVLETARRSLQ
mmetsp:Transcript_33934/g.44769  ORF Transcript_33934/g.44769 Transcript_33934/m.44769 type:complete len:261 (+) Transcript_33934:89-871(+)|eukprot:CAMPEP_0117756040 /NCGR_PEP_ID=MMETSP0947-20121206/13817_1 /TAXON_ID=44440 /ORGANISM="Chattonella subsalsa, Strain CCMP2191" /LENGTH=260 /DNA_ID=CAMNT_0005575503 /DNA_START=89 /DNA_END=871 /DNA_ORIENTATION=-